MGEVRGGVAVVWGGGLGNILPYVCIVQRETPRLYTDFIFGIDKGSATASFFDEYSENTLHPSLDPLVQPTLEF